MKMVIFKRGDSGEPVCYSVNDTGILGLKKTSECSHNLPIKTSDALPLSYGG